MNFAERMITIAVVVIGTMITRFLPFILFPQKRETPRFIEYLGKVLPAAVFGLLVVYSLKDIDFLAGNRGIPELFSTVLVIVIHKLKHQMLLSIAAGTIFYMFLVQNLF